MLNFENIDIFTIDSVDIIRNKNKTKNVLGAFLTILIPFVLAFFFIYLFLTNQMKPDIVSDNIYYTKDLQSPVDFKIEFNYDFVKNDSIAWFEMVTDDVKQTECYKNKSSTKHNRDEVKLCDYSTDSIGENNGVGFVFKMDVEDSYKTFLNVDEVESPFYMSPDENVVYVTKPIKEQMCQIFLNMSKSICYNYNVLGGGSYNKFIDDTGDVHLDIYDSNLKQTYYFINDKLVEHYVYNRSDIHLYKHYRNNTKYIVFYSRSLEYAYYEIYQNDSLIYTNIYPFSIKKLLDANIYPFVSVYSNVISFESVDLYNANKYNIYLYNYFTNQTFTYSLFKSDNESFDFVEYVNIENYLVYSIITEGIINITRISLLDFSILTKYINLDIGERTIISKESAASTESNVLSYIINYNNNTNIIYFIDKELNVEYIIDNNHINILQNGIVLNFFKLNTNLYKFFTTNNIFPRSLNNWKNVVDYSHIFECEITIDHYFNCSTKYTNYLQSNIQRNYSSIENEIVATVYLSESKFELKVKDVIPQWNQNTKTMYSNVITMDYNDKTLMKSNDIQSKMLYSTYMNSSELNTGNTFNINNIKGDLWIFDNYNSGHSSKFKCFVFNNVYPNDITILENSKLCKIKDVYSIPFLLPDRIQLFDSKFDFEYKSNLTSGVILFNMNPTYKVTTYTSTKTPIINILMSVVGIISPLIAAFTFVKKFWYKYENKEEINRRTSLVIDNPSIVEVLLDKNINNVDTNNIDINVELSKVRNNKDIV